MNDIESMQFILHVSDFHLKKAADNIVAEKAFEALVKKLQIEDIQIKYLIHTGDVIDARAIQQDVIKKCNFSNLFKDKNGKLDLSLDKFNQDATSSQIHLYNETLKKLTKARYKIAARTIRKIITILNIPIGNVIICCGNHDVMRLAHKITTTGKIKCKKSKDGLYKITYCVNESCEKTNKLYERFIESEYKPFCDFLDDLEVANSFKRLAPDNRNYPAMFCSVKDLNVLLLNTNWQNPNAKDKTYFCVKCGLVNQTISQRKRIIHDEVNASTTKGVPKLNIIVAHKPIYEVCETARLSYKRYIKTSFMASVHSFIGNDGVYLCGDKHTRSIVGSQFHSIPHYLCGEPFDVQNKEENNYEVEYNLLGFQGSKIEIVRKIHLTSQDLSTWKCKICPQDSVVDELYDICKIHISPQSLELLGLMDERNTWETLRQRLYQPDSCTLLKDTNIDTYFKSIIKCRINGKYNDNISTTNIFEYVMALIKDNTKRNHSKNILNLRGEQGSGKSTFLGLLYVYMLYQYSIGEIDFIPAYFALENQEMLSKVQSSTSYFAAVKDSFNDFTKKIQTIANKEHQGVCYIIDRIDEQDLWSLSSEESVGRGLLDILAQYSNSWYVMSYGQYRLPFFKDTMPVLKYNDESNVIYFNPIDTSNVFNEKMRAFFRSFLSLELLGSCVAQHYNNKLPKNIEEIITDCCTITQGFRQITVSPGFIRKNKDFILERDDNGIALKNKNSSVAQIYKYYIDKQYDHCLEKIGYGFVNYAPAMAYLFAFHGFTYEKFMNIKNEKYPIGEHIRTQIKDNHSKIYRTFMFIKKHRDSREYLIALHYHKEMRYYAEHQEENISSTSILQEFITRNVAVEIRKMWTDTNKFIIVCRNLLRRKDIGYCLLSMLVYCLSHIKMYKPLKDELKEELRDKIMDMLKQQDIAKSIWIIPDGSANIKLNYFLQLSLSYSSELFLNFDDQNTASLVKKLISDKDFAKYNRQHQMLYYRDLVIHGEDKLRYLNPGVDTVYNSFDFFHCFHYLYAKLSSYHDNIHARSPYPLREYDLFTLCDLLNSRLNPDQNTDEIKVTNEKISSKEDTFLGREILQDKPIQILDGVIRLINEYLQEAIEELGKNQVTLTADGFKSEKVKNVFSEDKIFILEHFSQIKNEMIQTRTTRCPNIKFVGEASVQ